MLSNSSSSNPHLSNWTKVFVGYCDGGSYAGDVLPPQIVGSDTIYYRGAYILDAVYKELFLKHGLDSAESLVVAGCSAGGLAAYIHLDSVCSKVRALNPSIRCLGAPGAGFFMGEEKPYSGNGYLDHYQWVFSNMNVSTHTNADCVAAKTADNTTWKCFIAPEVLPFIKTPLFVSNSLSDAWQAPNIMGLGCSATAAGKCSSAQMAYLANFRSDMLQALAPVLAKNSPHGGFLQACFTHVVEDVGGWTSVLINGMSQAETFWNWFTGTGTPVQVDTFPPWSNPTC